MLMGSFKLLEIWTERTQQRGPVNGQRIASPEASDRMFQPCDRYLKAEIPSYKEISMPSDKHEIERTRPFRPAGTPIHDAVISKETSGHVHTKAATAKQGPGAIVPPLSEKPIPPSSMAERLRERLKKGD